MKTNKKGVGKNTRAFSLGRTDPIPAVFLILVGPRWDNAGGNMTFGNFAKKNALKGNNPFSISTHFRQNKSTDLRVKSIRNGICFLEPITFRAAKSADTSTMGFWADGQTQFWRTSLQNPLPRMTSNEKGVGKNTRALCLGCTDLFPSVFLILVGPRWDNAARKMTFPNSTKKNVLTGGSPLFASTPFLPKEIDRFEGKKCPQ